MSGSAAPLSIDSLSSWSDDFKTNDITGQLAATVLQNSSIDDVLLNRDIRINNSKHVFNTKIEMEGVPITNQFSSGRCWLFASTNLFRLSLMKKYNIKELRLSPSYLFFYDKLEKANFFLEQIIDTYKEDVNSRLVQYLLTDPICDGGQFDMMTNILDKYGLVPYDIYPDTFNTKKSSHMNILIVRKLREFAEILRTKLEKGESIVEDKISMQQEIYRLLCIFLGTPPNPNQEFTWEFYNKEDKYCCVKSTPLNFVHEHMEFDTSKHFSILNDSRNPYNKVIEIERLGNVHGAKTVSYLNLDIDTLSKACVARLKNNKAIFFGTDTPKYMHESGIMDLDLWDHKLFGYTVNQTKASRVVYHESLMTHAMLITAVHLDEAGNPVRWRVENSWGEKVGDKGYYTMTHDYFKEYVYQAVVDEEDAPEVLSLLKDDSPIKLPPYDPMGALALFNDSN